MFDPAKLLMELQPPALTVRAQTVSPNDNGTLMWDRFFPRVDAASIKLADIFTNDSRLVADRREWDAPGRFIPLVIPNWREMEMLPIEGYQLIGEREQQLLGESSFGNREDVMRTLGIRIPDRVDTLVSADYRRLEIDAFEAWANNRVIVRNPQTGTTVTTSYAMDTGRFQTAGTAWSAAGVNAWNEFKDWLQDAEDEVGLLEGVAIRRATLNVIMEDAPVNVNQATMTQSVLSDLVTQVMGNAFRFEIMENSLDVFDDGGIATTRTKVWPANHIAAIPAGGMVGNTAFAPVLRAMEIARAIPGAGIDVRGATVYYLSENDGKTLKLQAQLNAMPMPNEQKVFVMDAQA